MASKDQNKRGNREARKPKKEKPKVTAAQPAFGRSEQAVSMGKPGKPAKR